MASVVLVHGAWHWGGCWDQVRVILEQAGHTVYTPSLELHRGSTLARHVEQVVDLIREERLDQIVLMGHSYGGVVVSGVLARVPSRVHHTIFLDAILPEPGRSPIAGLLPPAGVIALIGLSQLQPMWPAFISAEGFGISDPAAARWVNSHLKPHPGATIIAPFPYAPDYDPARCTYVICRESIRITDTSSIFGGVMSRFMPEAPLAIFSKRAAAAGWKVIDLPVGHNAMVIVPEQVADLITGVLPQQSRQVDG